jgi:hypothetical protein
MNENTLVQYIYTTDVTTLFFLNIQTDHHSGTTTCRSANIWHTPHNMYLIIRVISNSEKHNDTIIISAEKHI